MSSGLRHLYLGHLSRECNRPDLAYRVIQQRLAKIGASHVRVELTSQSVPCSALTVQIDGAEAPQAPPAPPPRLAESPVQAHLPI